MVCELYLDTPTAVTVGFWANLYVRGVVYEIIMNNYLPIVSNY